MHKRFIACVVILSISVVVPSIAFGQGEGKQSDVEKSNAAFDPHDLSGVWEFFHDIPKNQGLYASPSKQPPERTAWGQARYDEAKPGYGPKAQAGGNDPILSCTPSGVPRIMLYVQPFQVIQTPNQVAMLFEREHSYRQIWTDGRQHPADLTPAYLGDSIGQWEGDTLVVDSVGFNDAGWLDFFGNPHSDELHVVERYKRISHNQLTLQFTVEDPKAYTAPWVSDTKIYTLLPPSKALLEENFCVPEEEDAFTKKIRDPETAKPN